MTLICSSCPYLASAGITSFAVILIAGMHHHSCPGVEFFLFNFLKFIYFMWMNTLYSAYHVHAWRPWRWEKGIRSLRAGVPSGCEYHVDAENWAQVLSRVHSVLNHRDDSQPIGLLFRLFLSCLTLPPAFLVVPWWWHGICQFQPGRSGPAFWEVPAHPERWVELLEVVEAHVSGEPGLLKQCVSEAFVLKSSPHYD